MTTTRLSWSAAWRIARRDLNARFKGLRLLLVCLFLGTGALAAIGTLTGAIEGELASRGQELLGGDLEVEVWQRDLNPDEKAALADYGTLSGGTRMQAMARAGEEAAPVELKAIDERWPLYGTATLAAVAADLQGVYDIPPEQCEAEVLQFVGNLRDHCLVEPRD